MNRDDVLRVAKECGFEEFVPYFDNRRIAVFERFAAAMYAAGAGAMRERAALKADELLDSGFMNAPTQLGFQVCSAIRALPITPTNTEGEQGVKTDAE